jgi:hypothetical protein
MRLNLKKAFESILRWVESSGGDGNLPVSIVLLLREPKFLTLDQLRSSAQRAFGVSFNGDKESRHCVIQPAFFTIMKAGPHTLSFLNYTKPYGEDSPEFGKSMPTASQRQAWAGHTAWTAVDYAKGTDDLEHKYAVLAVLCLEMVDANCTGLYVPRERSFIPNDGSLLVELKKIASARHFDIA